MPEIQIAGAIALRNRDNRLSIRCVRPPEMSADRSDRKCGCCQTVVG